jgi:hypothetical protein
MLVTEELFLLLRRDSGQPESAFAHNSYGLSAAVVADLLLTERVTASDEDDPRITVVTERPTSHPVLDAALEVLRAKPARRLSALVTDAELDPEQDVARSLAEAGIIGIEQRRLLGLVAAKYPMLDPSAEVDVRRRLRDVLAGGAPRPADAVLLSILQGLDLAAEVLDQERGQLSKRELRRRITEVATDVRGDGAVADAVAYAVMAMNTAILTAVIMPVVVSGTSSSCG